MNDDQMADIERQMKHRGKRPKHQIEAKRFRIPSVVVATCPDCGVEVRREFVDSPLMFPRANEPLTLRMEHAVVNVPELFHEFDVQIELHVELVALSGCRVEHPA